MFDLLIKGGILATTEERADIAVADGKIVNVASEVQGEASEVIDARDKVVSMGFIDTHLHADKALSDNRVPEEERPGEYVDRVRAARAVKDSFTADDVRERAGRVFRMAVAHGTTTMRVQVELDPIVDTVTAEGVLAAIEDCRDIIDVQTVSFPQEGWASNDLEMDCRPYVRRGLAMGLDYVGGNMNPNWLSDMREQIDDVFEMAREFSVGVDIHLDNIPNGAGYHLPYVARKTVEYGLQGRVTVSHLTSLPFLPAVLRERSIDAATEAGVFICSPGNRITPMAEIMNRGGTVVIGSDNMQDVFTGLGNADILGMALFLARVNVINRPQKLRRLFRTFTTDAARALELEDRLGLQEGKQADLVIVNSNSVPAAIRDLGARLYVIKRGKVVARSGEMVV